MKPTTIYTTSRRQAAQWFGAGFLAMSMLTAAAQERIVGGTQAQPGDYPWMVALTEKGVTPANAQFCGGALIDSQWIATAAHCVEGVTPNNTDVVVGAYDLRDAQGGQRIAITEIRVHPRYNDNSNNSEADIALLKLARPVTDIGSLQLVDSSSQIAPGTLATVTGFGRTSDGGPVSSVLRQVEVPLVSLAVANQVYGDLNSFHLGAGFAQGGKDSCQGDSGGPLVVRAGNDWRLAGVVSFGNGCAEPNAYGIYANVLTLRQWLLEEMGRPGGENPPPTDDGGNDDSSDNPDDGGDNPPPTPPTAGDDHGDELASATSIVIPSTTAGQLEAAYDLDTFAFTLANDATVTIESTGSTDTYAYLESSNGYITEDDSSGAIENFRITEDLAAGTYYVTVEAFDPSSQTGSYQVKISSDGADAVLLPEAVVFGPNNAVIASGDDAPRFAETTVGQTSAPLNLSVLNDGDGRLDIDGLRLQGAGAAQFQIVAQPASQVNAGRSTAFSVAFAPQSAGQHEARIVLSSNDSDTPNYAIALSGFAVAPVTGGDDDHGDDIDSATAVDVPDVLDAVLDNGDVDVFGFNLARSGKIVLRTTGDLDTYGTLVDADGQVVAEDDDRGSGFNFRIRRRLDAGDYFLIVEGYDESEAGEYGLIVKLR